ncbi:MAG: hypothetical protein AB9891_07455 [Anaerolineaceae bacterium]
MKTYSRFALANIFLVCTVLISSCGTTSPQNSAPVDIRPTPTDTQNLPTKTVARTNTITPLPSATITHTPHGIVLDYFVSVSSYETISITIEVSNISSSKITLYRLATPTPDSLPPISVINVFNESRNKIDYTLDGWEGQGDRHLELLNITANGKRVFITYTLNLLSSTYWKATPKYIAIPENQVFFQPDADELNTEKMQFYFKVPTNWKVATRLTPALNGYALSTNNTFRVFTHNNWQRFFLGAPFAIGEIEIIETPIDDVRIIAAYPSDEPQYANDASNVSKIYSYQKSLLGNSSHNIGDYGFLYFFGAKAGSGDLITTIESFGTFEVEHVKDDRHLAHEMYHAWWGDGHFLPDAWRFIRLPGWFVEGTNEYLGVKAHLATGAFTPEMASMWQKQFYTEYKSIAGTSSDKPLSQCQNSIPFRTSAWYICLYSKSHTALFLLDQTLETVTDQKAGIEVLYKNLLEKYSSNPEKVISEGELLLAVNQISGYDFKPFFDAYITGNELMPIKIYNGQLEVEFDKLPELKKKK